MKPPTDGALIVAATVRPDVDSHAPWGPQANLGRTEYRCLRCGRDWGEPKEVPLKGDVSRTCPYCGFNECEIVVVKPTAMEIVGRRPDGTWVTAPSPEAPQPKVLATEQDVEALRVLRDVLVETETRLLDADAALHRLVKMGDREFEVFSFLQQATHGLTDGNIGDFELRASGQVTALSLLGPIKALRVEIDRTLVRFEEERKK